MAQQRVPPAHRSSAVSVARTQQWPSWSVVAAGAWSALYALLALYWSAGGAGFPFGSAGDPGAGLSILGGVTRDLAPLFVALGFGGTAVAFVMARLRVPTLLACALLAVAVTTAAVLALLVPDYRVLVAIAYTPVFVVGTPFGWPPGVSLREAYPWPVVNQLICIGGGLFWALAAVAYTRHLRAACLSCGRGSHATAWSAPAAAGRWGRWAVGVAVVIPVLYAITRWAWALGIPLGISQAFLQEGQAIGLWWAGAALATLAVGGALLTLGLVQRWGEVFWRWLPVVGGRRVPPALAIVPATLVAVLVTAAGLMFVRLALSGTLDNLFGPEARVFSAENWAVLAPELLWPLWGAALGGATLAYHYRRRGRCAVCGRDT